MSLGDYYILGTPAAQWFHCFVPAADATDEGATLTTNHTIRIVAASISRNEDGMMYIYHTNSYSNIPGYVYEKDGEKGYVFSGASIADNSVIPHAYPVGGSVLNRAQLYSIAVGGKNYMYYHIDDLTADAKYAVKLPAISSWTEYGEGITVPVAGINWETVNYGATDIIGTGQTSYTPDPIDWPSPISRTGWRVASSDDYAQLIAGTDQYYTRVDFGWDNTDVYLLVDKNESKNFLVFPETVDGGKGRYWTRDINYATLFIKSFVFTNTTTTPSVVSLNPTTEGPFPVRMVKN